MCMYVYVPLEDFNLGCSIVHSSLLPFMISLSSPPRLFTLQSDDGALCLFNSLDRPTEKKVPTSAPYFPQLEGGSHYAATMSASNRQPHITKEILRTEGTRYEYGTFFMDLISKSASWRWGNIYVIFQTALVRPPLRTWIELESDRN